MSAEHLLVVIVGIAALYFFWRVMRSPSARAELAARQRRRDFKRSLINRSILP